MNSIIQCLSNTNYLVRYFCDGSYREHLNRSNETKGRIAEEVATVITSLWSGHYRAVAIREFKVHSLHYQISEFLNKNTYQYLE